jgi:hypothetical protein
MPLSNADKQRRFRERRNHLAQIGAAVQAGEALPPIPAAPPSQRRHVEQIIGDAIRKLEATVRRPRGKGETELADARLMVGIWRIVQVRLVPGEEGAQAAPADSLDSRSSSRAVPA